MSEKLLPPIKSVSPPPLVMHLIYRLTSGGLENGLVNLVNHMPPDRFRHVIVCMAGYTCFRDRIRRADVPVLSLDKRPGHDLGYYGRLWRILRSLKPDILHTRTFPALDGQLLAAAAGVAGRVHGEHGRDTNDWEDEPRRRRWLRQATDHVINHYIAVSDDIAGCIIRNLGLSPDRVTRIYNGVDTTRFSPEPAGRPTAFPGPFHEDGAVVLGWTGGFRPVKNPLDLVRAFLRVRARAEPWKRRLRLVMIGDGPQREDCRQLLRSHEAHAEAWLPGTRDDIPEMLRGMDVFVLPSLAEGISNSVLEAMATALPVIATDVGGNRELVLPEETGLLVPPTVDALVEAVRRYLGDEDLRTRHGLAGRRRAETFRMRNMVEGYGQVYDRVMQTAR